MLKNSERAQPAEMELVSSLPSVAIILLTALGILLWAKTSNSKRKLPPGPPGWPVFGHMFNLGSDPHITTAKLKEKYGPVIWLRIGSMNTMMILNAKAAAEFFKNHDISFADRNIVETMRSHNYNESSLVLAPYGSFWRMLRRLCTVEMFTQKKINETEHVRRKCIDDMLLWIEDEANNIKEEGGGIQVTRFIFLAGFNMVGNLMLSRNLVDPKSKKASDFYTAMMGVSEWTGKPNISDLFGFVKPFDLQGLKRKIDRDMGKALEIASAFVKERMNGQKEGQEKKKDFLDVLIEFEGNGKDEPDKLSEHDINVFILEIFLAGSETTSSSAEWVLTELLRHPEEMTKVQAEIDKIVEVGKKLEEKDIDRLPYLQAVVKEGLRLHPPLPFLIPRRATCDTNFMGYQIPKNTQVLVNVWAIGRDPDCWDDPMSFKPQRFIGSKVDYKGQHFEYIPFGAGRRMCVGIPLGHRMLHFVLGSLLHEFDWELDGSIKGKPIDMRDRVGSTMRKFVPLRAVPRKRIEQSLTQ
uniref:Cytochrome P450 n=1 Tax=Arnebia euchroma TaxID=373122 RepID=A0A3T0ICC4_ARNEU|nr:cytochrome P450 [Arnebia euchroma]